MIQEAAEKEGTQIFQIKEYKWKPTSGDVIKFFKSWKRNSLDIEVVLKITMGKCRKLSLFLGKFSQA